MRALSLARFLQHAHRKVGARPDLISAIDITAAMSGLAGAPVPKHFAGIDFLHPSVRKGEYVFAARDRIDDTVARVRSVCIKRFKYIRNFYRNRPYAQPNAYQDTDYPTLRAMRDLYKQGKLTPEQALFIAQTRPPEELYDLNGVITITQDQKVLPIFPRKKWS
jgi:N-sulfoglucosamine sulfohydrolase